MAVEFDQAFCEECNRRVRAERKATNHILHLLLTILTLGLWIPFWSLSSVRIGGWRCPHCGSTKLKRKFLGWGTIPENPTIEHVTSALTPESPLHPQRKVAVNARPLGHIFGALKFFAISLFLGIGAVVWLLLL